MINDYRDLCDFWHDEGNFLFHAVVGFGVPENQAIVDWRNTHRVGKYVICESKKEDEKRKYKRLYIRNVMNVYMDAHHKNGWWDTFTLSETDVPTGLWLCVIKEFRLDKNGYVNMIVDAVAPIPEIKCHFFFEAKEGTWNSPAIKLMLGSGNFIPEYNFYTFRDLNVEELRNRFPQYSALPYKELCDKVLKDWLANKVSLEEIENALNEKTAYEKLIIKIQNAVFNGKMEKEFPEYPLFAEKITNTKSGVKEYVERNIFSYHDLVADGKISETSEYPLDMVEAVLLYRKKEKELAKQARKEKRKNK